MTDIKAFRNKYGLTQDQLAFYLSVSLSMIKMAELGQRTLPTAALLKLNELLQNAERHGTAKKGDKQDMIIPLKDKKAVLLINRRMQELTASISKIERDFDAAAALQEKGRNKIGLVNMLSAAGKSTKQESSWLRLLELEASASHNSYNSAKQLMLQLKLESLRFEQSRLQELIQR